EDLDQRGAVLLVESRRPRHLVHLLGHVGEEHGHSELLGERRLQLLVLEGDVDGAARGEVTREHLRGARLEGEARARARPHHVVDGLRIETGLTPRTSASATATVLTCTSMLFTSFMARPWPRAPTWKTFLPMASKRTLQAATVSGAPP